MDNPRCELPRRPELQQPTQRMGSMRRTSQTPEENAEGTLAAAISFLTAVGFVLIGLWTEQPVYFFMAGSVLFISVAEVLSSRRPNLARTAKWVGRIGVLIAILYILIILLPGD